MPSTPNYDWVFPLLTVTPGLQASCPTSLAQPDVVQSASPTVSGKGTSSHHELTAALSEDKAAMVSDARFEAFDVNIRAQGTVYPPCSG